MADNLADLVRAAGRSRPESAALLAGRQQVTWADLDARVDRVAAGLVALGLSPGDRVGLALGNTVDFVAAYFATLRAGLVSVPLNTGYTGRELTALLLDSGSRALVATEGVAALALQAGAALPDLRYVLVGDGGSAPAGALTLEAATGQGAGALPAEAATGGEDLAVLIYTSGTSGTPKGAMLSHRALLANLDQLSRISPPVIGADDRVLLVLPLFHIYGLNPGLGMVARHAATGVLAERFEPQATLELMARHEVTTVVGAPPMYVAWSLLPDLTAGFARVRLALSGSAPLAPQALQQIRQRTGKQVFEGYGLTETGPVLTSTLCSELAKPDSIGRPIPGVEVKLVDDRGDEVDEADHGELVVRGENLFSGYWPDGAGGPDPDGWWPTGDVAYADSDADLHLVDRRTELIVVSGFNVYPREVELVLLTDPGIADAVVVAIPNPYTGEAIKAIVQPRPGLELTEAAVIAHCERSLARFKCPTAVEFVAELPRSAAGKVRRGVLRAGAQRDEGAR
ncbi:MAG: AMP-binding protein [Actinomycetota bacterium]|nr:AMP-binding protein [Actinomycetota bacterium]